MISLVELLHSVDQENKDGLVNIDNWRWPDVDHLATMGFEFDDDYHMTTKKDTKENGGGKITVYKKKGMDESNKPQTYFFVEEEGRKTKRFADFNSVIDYFDTYSQPDVDKNM
jgi:hypothetical protein